MEEDHKNTDKVREIFENTVMEYSKKKVPMESILEESAAQKALICLAKDFEVMKRKVVYLTKRVHSLEKHIFNYAKTSDKEERWE